MVYLIYRPEEVGNTENVQQPAKPMASAGWREMCLTLSLWHKVEFVIWVQGPATRLTLGESVVEFPDNAKEETMLNSNAEYHARKGLGTFE